MIVAAFASVGLLVVHHVQGATTTVPQSVPYSESGTFSYGRTVEGGVYDNDTLGAPEPLFRALIDELPLEYEYRLAPAAPGAQFSSVIGSYRLYAEIGPGSGWKRTIEIQPLTLFGGDGFSTAAVVDLSEVDRQPDAIEETIGIDVTVYTMRVVAAVSAQGELDGLPFVRELEQALAFQLTDLQLQFAATVSELELTNPGSVSRYVAAGRDFTVPMIGYQIPYALFPRIAAVGLGFSALTLLVIALATFATWRAGEAARVQARYGHLLVEVEEREIELRARPMSVSQFEDLVRLAEREGLPILHRSGRQADEYFVFERDVAYSFVIWQHQPRLADSGLLQVGATPPDGAG